MIAAVLEELGKFAVKPVPTPVPDDDSILVKVRACAVCGSDLRIYRKFPCEDAADSRPRNGRRGSTGR